VSCVYDYDFDFDSDSNSNNTNTNIATVVGVDTSYHYTSWLNLRLNKLGNYSDNTI
jgi:hypothetical protein